jgi:hypothetical protein
MINRRSLSQPAISHSKFVVLVAGYVGNRAEGRRCIESDWDELVHGAGSLGAGLNSRIISKALPLVWPCLMSKSLDAF